MGIEQLVAVTRRLPRACEDRLAAHYQVRWGDDDVDYTPEVIGRFAENATAILVTPSERMDAAAIGALPGAVRVIASNSVGFEHIDLAAARSRGMRVTHTPGVLTDATADLALLLILAATRRAGEGERMVRDDRWQGIRPTAFLGSQITGKRLGIVGMGRIGAAVARRAQAFGMSVLYHNRTALAAADAGGATYVPTLQGLLSQADVLSLHCPLTEATQGMLNAEAIAALPKDAVVVNTARGGLVDDEALIAALRSGRLAAAGLDVYANEPRIDPRYRDLENIVLLPHIGSATLETRTAMGMLAIDNIAAVLSGQEPPNAVV